MELFDFAPILAIPAVIKIMDAYRQAILERDLRKTLFTVGSWVIGIGVTALVAESSTSPLPELNLADLILFGIGLGSTASVVRDFSVRSDVTMEVGTVENIEVE